MDAVAGRYYPNVHTKENAVISIEPAWLKDSSKRRLGDILIGNMEEYLGDVVPNT